MLNTRNKIGEGSRAQLQLLTSYHLHRLRAAPRPLLTAFGHSAKPAD